MMKKRPNLSEDWTREPTACIEASFLWFFFNCDGIGHFANKCPHKKKRNEEGYSKGRQTYKDKRTTKKVFKKSLCTKEDISSSDEVSDSETGRVLFMAVEDSDKEEFEEEYEEDKEEYEEVEEEYE